MGHTVISQIAPQQVHFIRFNHIGLLRAVLSICGVPRDRLPAVIECLQAYESTFVRPSVLRGQLVGFGLDPRIASRLEPYFTHRGE